MYSDSAIPKTTPVYFFVELVLISVTLPGRKLQRPFSRAGNKDLLESKNSPHHINGMAQS